MPDPTSLADNRNAWRGLTFWKSPEMCEDPFLNSQWNLIKGQGFVETSRQWFSPALGPKGSQRGNSNDLMMMKSLVVTPFNETLSLPLEVWGSDAFHKGSPGSDRSPGYGAGSLKPCATEVSHSQYQDLCGGFSELKELSWNRKKTKRNCLLPTCT